MSDTSAAAFRARFQVIERQLDALREPGDSSPPSPEQRDAVKREIVALFKQVDAALTDLAELKEQIRGLVERYKQANAAAADGAPAPRFTGVRPAVQADHLGA